MFNITNHLGTTKLNTKINHFSCIRKATIKNQDIINMNKCVETLEVCPIDENLKDHDCYGKIEWQFLKC